MNLDQLALLGEAIGGLAVVLTLLYLAYETRRNNAILIASATSDAYLKWTEINDLISSNEQLAGLWVRIYDNCPLESFEANERFRITVSVRSIVQRVAAVHSLYHNGLVDKAYWQTITTWLAGYLKVPAISQWWDLEKQSSLFSEEFIREIDSIIGFSIGPGGQRQNRQDQPNKAIEADT